MTRPWRICLLLSTTVALLPVAPAHSTDATDALEAGWNAPPLSARPKALWPWINGNTDLAEITHELEEAKAKGMGGFDIWDIRPVVDDDKVVPAGPAFMSAPSVDAISHAVREATRLGLEIGLVVSSGWNAGGSWTTPEHRTMGLFRSRHRVDGPADVSVVLPFPELPRDYGDQGPALIERGADGLPLFWRDVAVLAIPGTPEEVVPTAAAVVDLSSRVDATGRLTWQAPPGRWEIVRYVCANTGQPLISHSANSGGPMIDHFSAEATEAHLRFFIDHLEAELGPLRNTALKYFYTDSYEVRGDLWTPRLPDEFRKRAGYDLASFLPALDGRVVVDRDTTDRFLFDYRKVLSDLIIEGHYVKAKEVCHGEGIAFAAEAAGPGQPIHNCPFEALKSSGSLDLPRGEFWHRLDGGSVSEQILQVVKGVASAAHIYGQRFVEAEAFTSVWLWQESLAELKPDADRAFCEGLNRIVFHTFPHTPKAAGRPGWVYSFGTQISETQPWWPKAKPFMDYLARISFLLQRGEFVADVLYYYGDGAPNFVPPKRIDPSLGFGYDYDVVNSDVLLRRVEAKGGRLALPTGGTYALLVLPDTDAMDLDVLLKLEALVRAGATVVGPKPIRSLGLRDRTERDAQVRRVADALWGAADGRTTFESRYGEGRVVWGRELRAILAEGRVGPDFSYRGALHEGALDFIHRRDGSAEIYFLRNSLAQPISVDGVFRVSGKGAEIWDPLSGERRPGVVAADDGAATRLPLDLPPHGSVFVVFRPGAPPPSVVAVERDGVRLFPLPGVLPMPRDSSVAPDPSGTLLAKSPGRYVATKRDGRRVDLGDIVIPPPVALKSGWSVTFPLDPGRRSVPLPDLVSWSRLPEDDLRFFSGIATYSGRFALPSTLDLSRRRAVLDLGRVEILAHVFVNGVDCGVAWAEPFAVDVTAALKAGSNDVTIEVANTWPNRLIGDARLPRASRRTNTNIVRLPNAWMYPMKDLPTPEYPLREAGLLGPVRLVFEARLPLD
jgi:hypothetical protein